MVTLELLLWDAAKCTGAEMKQVCKMATPTNAMATGHRAVDAEKKINVLKKAVLKVSKEKAEAEETIATLNGTIDTLKKRCTDLTEENEKLDFQTNGLQRKIKSLERELDESADKLKENEGWGSGMKKVGSLFGGGASGEQTAKSKEEMEVLQDELQRMIGENEQLHITAFGLKQDHENEVKKLKAEVDKLR
eukprot:gene21281-8067_t